MCVAHWCVVGEVSEEGEGVLGSDAVVLVELQSAVVEVVLCA